MLVRTGTTLALLLASLPAQQGKPDLRETLDGQLLETLLPKLASDEPRDVAWGAHLLGHYRLAGAADALRAALRRFRDEKGQPARQVRLYLIDALLLLEVRLPANEFVFLLDDPLTRVPAFLCAAMDVQGHAELLAELAKTGVGRDLVPFAAGGLLVDERKLRRKPADFARHLLTLARARLSVRVEDAKSSSGPWNSAVGLGGPRETYYAIARDFPRMPYHTLARADELRTDMVHVLRTGARADDDIWRTGTDGVLGRLPAPPGGRCADSAVIHARNLVRRISSSALVEEREESPLHSSTAARWLERMAKHSLPSQWHSQEVQFSDVATLGNDVQRLHAEMQAYGNGLIEDLIEEGWLPKDEPTTFVLPIEVTVRDSRGDQSIPLPSVDELLGRPAPTPQSSPR